MLNTNEKIIKHKVGLLNLAQELGNVSKACQVMGLSRDTFYRYKTAVDENGVDALIDISRRKPNLKNRIDPRVEDAVIDGPNAIHLKQAEYRLHAQKAILEQIWES